MATTERRDHHGFDRLVVIHENGDPHAMLDDSGIDAFMIVVPDRGRRDGPHPLDGIAMVLGDEELAEIENWARRARVRRQRRKT